MSKITQSFGVNVFNDVVMRERLPKSIYVKLRKTIDEGVALDAEVAEVVANAMKDWAIEKGATHFTHWFQPMNGRTAGKLESFISPKKEGTAITEFSGKELIKGEPDASSFPNGGLRTTFEARGYTVWDCTSYAFLVEDEGGAVLYIPTAFCSYTGDALDKKTPLLRSMEAVSKEALRVLRLLGNGVSSRVIPMVGAEQEYFLIDKEIFKRRKDLIYAGRTLIGAKPPKGQELEDHYFGSINEKVAAFMKEIDEELWKVGVSARTKHKEVAPNQYEIAPVFTNANVAADHNQIIMETLLKVANRHGLVCLLHEKPFKGVNGSGKHVNFSLMTNDGINLFDPGKTPHDNLQFLLFLAAVIKGVDEYQDLIRISASNPGNDHRLGANEAPPAIVSIFLGEQLTEILEQIEKGEIISSRGREKLETGVITLPVLKKDTTDRNRTSPFAFTGNKFEFRMVPSSASISDAVTVLNTILADKLGEFADRLQNSKDVIKEAKNIIRETVKEHKRIIFNGDGYSKEWIEEAERRGLLNLKSSVDAIKYLISKKNMDLFERHKVLNKNEIFSRYEVMLEGYIKQLLIEARTMVEIFVKDIVPSVSRYMKDLAKASFELKNMGFNAEVQLDLLRTIDELFKRANNQCDALKKLISQAESFEEDSYNKACFIKDNIFTQMETLRELIDDLEKILDRNYWPMPTYGDIMFN
ncbi:glutamine synthetase III [Caloramator australicus]|uniref:Glutamine synthetase type III, GlnN n=1 Tax=Caloramator australicus RC3 TaxID=857293 RepID=G0V468_9CLOT|nr:glutamine synthetase III [Caloramator australicus]CCC57908.1 Glutamine synthetase type III, GlnN [Caloramator australicus RC3]